MPTLKASGTASNTTEATLGSAITDAGTYQLVVDLAALVNDDILTLRAYYKCLSGGTERLFYTAEYWHAQGEPIKAFLPIPSDIEVRFSLEQTAARSIPWKVLEL